MLYILTFCMGLIAGGICVFLQLYVKKKQVNKQKHKQDVLAWKMKAKQGDLDLREIVIAEHQKDIEARVVSYKEFQDENIILKRDLQNIDVNLRKQQLDGELQREAQEQLDQRSKELGGRYLKENVKWISSSLTPNNFVDRKKRLQAVVERCRGIGYEVLDEEEDALFVDLKKEFERVVRAAFEREEQARIKAQIREEQKLEKEIERELQQAKRERAAIQAALDKALAETEGKHSV